MLRLALLVLALIIASCLAAPEERFRRHGYDFGHGGYGGAHGGYGGHGYGGYGYGGAAPALTQTYTHSKATASASSSGGSIAG